MSTTSHEEHPTVDDAVQAALDGVAICRGRIAALHYATQGLQKPYDHRTELAQALDTLHALLYRELVDAYQRLFMWGVVDEGARMKAAEAAQVHFLNEHNAIMHNLLPDPRHELSGWNSESEAKFREAIAARFKHECLP